MIYLCAKRKTIYPLLKVG